MSVPPTPRGPGPDLPDDDAVLAAEYALGLLEGEERAAFVRRLSQEPGLRNGVAFWEESLAPLADKVDAVAPSAGLKRRVEAGLFAGRSAGRGLWRLLPWGLSALASAGAVAALLFGWEPLRAPLAPDSLLVAEIAGEEDAVRVLAAYDPERRGLRVERTAGEVPPDRALELWAIGADGVPVSLGLLPEEGVVPLPEALRAEVADLILAISEEPAGGSPTGAPTGPIRATGALVPL